MRQVAEYLPGFCVVVVVGALQGMKHALGRKADEPKVKGALYFGAWVLSGVGAVVTFVVTNRNPIVEVGAAIALASWIALRAIALYDGGKALLKRVLSIL